MGKINSRSKGKRGEREVINKIIQPIVNEEYARQGLEIPTIQRNHMQVDSGGHDIVGLEWCAIEVKLCETFHLVKWWNQTLSQATSAQIPILLYRRNRVAWRAVTWGYLPLFTPGNTLDVKKVKVDIDLNEFKLWFSMELRRRLQWEVLEERRKRANLPAYAR